MLLPRILTLAASLALAITALAASPNMVGRQSNNTGFSVVPAAKPVTIDGDLAEWDLSGRIHSFAEWDLRDSHSVETAAEYDAENLYIAFKWRDPSPMFSSVNPEFNPNDGWRSDAVQMRIHTDRNLWITTWFYKADKVPVMHFSYWNDNNDSRKGQTVEVLRAPAGGTDLGKGAAMAYKISEDGKGYVQECKIPWKLLYQTPPKIEAGVILNIGLEFIWGDDEKGGSPAHRYADNLQPGTTSREFFWTAVRAWGDAKLEPTGNVPVKQYALEKERVPGLVSLKFDVPEKATRFTVVLEDKAGKRIRNLLADTPVEDYASGPVKDGKRTIEVKWDALDDAGKLVPAGDYKARGLTRGNFDATFDATFYNPGTPPWYTSDGTGGFGSNHASPKNVARAGDRMILGYEMSEGGHAIIGINAQDRKIWGENRGATFLAGDDQYAYAISREVWTAKREVRLIRLGAADGSYQPFVLDGKPREFNLEIDDILGETPAPAVTALAVGKTQIALGLADGRVVLLDKQSAKPVQTLKPGATEALAFDAKDRLVGVVADKVIAIADGVILPTPGVEKPVSLVFDKAGNLAVADAGKESDTKLFSPAGKLVSSFGKKGGRPLRGKFDPQAMMHVDSITFDSKGRLWAAENWNYPRRFSVWTPDGSLDRDFIGGTGYAATSTFLHDTDPTLAYVGPIEMKLDRAAGTWAVSRILWEPQDGENFRVDTGTHTHPQRFTSKASGTAREYFFIPVYRPWQPVVLMMEKGDAFQPIAAIGNVAAMTPLDKKGEPVGEPTGLFAGHDVNDGFFWNDLNGDAKIDANELTFVPAAAPAGKGKKTLPALNVSAGWGARMSPDDLSFFAGGIVKYTPTSFSPEGAPRFGPEGMTTLPITGNSDMVPVPGENTLLNLWAGSPKSDGVDGLRGIDPKTGAVKWTYPNPFNSVHGSHRAPMSRPGLLVGPLKIMGTAKLDGDAGSLFAMRGNMGEDYVFTTDGLFAGTIFQDTRRPSDQLPPSVEALKGQSMNGFSEGGEPFSGWFSRQSDGKSRIGTSIGRNCGLTVEVRGFETIQRFSGPQVTLDPAILAKSDAENANRATAAAQPKSYVIRRVPKPMTIDGKANEWGRIPAVEPGDANIKIAYDSENLYALWEVADPNPMLNSGKEITELFKTGDCVDLQLATNPKAPHDRKQPAAGDLRIVISEAGGKPVAVLMKPIDPNAPKTAGKTYSSPVGSRHFDRVDALTEARIAIVKDKEKYTVEAAFPLTALGLQPEPAMEIRGDVGYISSDAAGIINTARTYWSNRSTGLVNDLPGEAELRPQEWGALQFSD